MLLARRDFKMGGTFDNPKKGKELSALVGCQQICHKCKTDSACRLHYKDKMTGKKMKSMPTTECLFQHFLEHNGLECGTDFHVQEKIEGCPFVKRGSHKSDFYFPKLDLYVEVKGYLTYYSVSTLHWLLKHSHENLYVLEVTNEDWLGRCDEGETAWKKISRDTIKQFNEILEFVRSGKVPDDINKQMLKRLSDYVRVRHGDVARWQKLVEEKNRNQT